MLQAVFANIPLLMPKGEKFTVEGVVVDMHPNAMFSIRIMDPRFPENYIVKGYIAGKMRMHYIRIIPGDKVTVELDPLDMTKGRIIFRKKEVSSNFQPHRR